MLYQNGTQRIEIIVRKEGGVGGNNAGAKQKATDEVADEKKTTFWGTLTGSENKQRQRRVIKTNATHALAITKQVADLTAEYIISGLGDKYGDQAYQEQWSRQYEIVKDYTGFASSVAMGALYGSWGGPIGTVLGATFGAVSSAASIGVKYAKREREFNYKVFKENNAIEYQRARASINLTTGRLR